MAAPQIFPLLWLLCVPAVSVGVEILYSAMVQVTVTGLLHDSQHLLLEVLGSCSSQGLLAALGRPPRGASRLGTSVPRNFHRLPSLSH